ncbi:hypothetical protein NQ317_011233 [Molorchus minor]|uniref:DNA/RNA non-specific endonuclease domain-containing protein n=1 Tax=Molorchus minor TaxID=1323400 RepID=A0ABQ9IR47_9CUCU|nr:hypothetical protein NQ317_011233 [Molorchus minor]
MHLHNGSHCRVRNKYYDIYDFDSYLTRENFLEKCVTEETSDINSRTSRIRQAVNGGNWKSVESVVKKSAQSYNSSFTILPVPKYIWKIVYHKNTKRGVVFIILNNPFIKSVSEIDLLCPNICDEYGWSRNNNWSNVKRGFVHCCDLTDFSMLL